MVKEERITMAEVEHEIPNITTRLAQIEAVLSEEGIPKEKKTSLREEKGPLTEKLAILQDACSHPRHDSSTGGGEFCRVCDQFLGMRSWQRRTILDLCCSRLN
ncbi:MAG: hypothetical protein CMI53_00205 [Parcubacteria group bacterium]|nr:hypothetical protein [Parcubacteria group bacterium]|tara:strand:- start:8247 stop:8555 length:309 start_codon:yes stop_codon:yes gene_type:complete